jgi:hypothetical protein
MKIQTYIVAYTLKNVDKSYTDHWERCESLDEAQHRYNELLVEEDLLYTASIANEVISTE